MEEQRIIHKLTRILKVEQSKIVEKIKKLKEEVERMEEELKNKH